MFPSAHDGPDKITHRRVQRRARIENGREVAVEHHGESVPLVSKMFPPFAGNPGDNVGLQITGMTHVFGDDGARIVSAPGVLR